MATSWKGLSARNPYLTPNLDQFDWFFIKGVLLSAAPSVVVGWRIGEIEPRPSGVWLSGFAGVWLPMVISVTIASLATQAGVNLHWKPSLFRDFQWALIGLHGRLSPTATTLTALTLLSPALFSAFSLKEMALKWGRRLTAWLVPALICLFSYAFLIELGSADSLSFDFASPFHEFWAWSLVIIGTGAGLIWALLPRSR